MKERIKQILSQSLNLVKSAGSSVGSGVSRVTASIGAVSQTVVEWVIGSPAELTYWIKGVEYKIPRIRDFKEITDRCIQYKNIDSGKHVRVKAEDRITYILREE